MSTRRLLVLSAVLGLTTFACGSAPSERTASERQAVTGDLVYYGGPILQNVKVYALYWGGATQQSQLNTFYSDITQSPYLDWLSEYDVTGQSIGRGSFAGSFDVAMPSGTSSTIDDWQIQATLEQMIANGALPAPDADTLYMNHFAPGVTVTVNAAGLRSCVDFVQYHSAFGSVAVHANVYYGVVPDQGGACAQFNPASYFDVTTANAGAALLNAITDPAGQLAQGNGAPLAWADSTSGAEMAFLCNQQDVYVDGFYVQEGWSNAFGACIAESPNAPPPPIPTCSATPSWCGGKVTIQCSGVLDIETVSRTALGSTVTVGSMSPTSTTVVDTPGALTASYQVCSATHAGRCTPAMSVQVNTRSCPVPTGCRGTTCQ